LPTSEDFARLLGSWGVTPATQVIVYDDVGGAVAARLWWLLRWVGHAQVNLLDGGLPAWLAADYPVDNQQPDMWSGRYPVAPGAMPTIEVEDVATGLERSTLALIDARDVKRFAGLSEPIDTRAGHIPGALNRPFKANLNDDGHFLTPVALRTEFDALLKGQENAQLACMCGSGVTACHNVLAMELAGVTSDSGAVAALYVGSWSEWIVSMDRPCDPAD
jgi:thiosulfate/3-mercaptopyruvate sulfurtransferase